MLFFLNIFSLLRLIVQQVSERAGDSPAVHLSWQSSCGRYSPPVKLWISNEGPVPRKDNSISFGLVSGSRLPSRIICYFQLWHCFHRLIGTLMLIIRKTNEVLSTVNDSAPQGHLFPMMLWDTAKVVLPTQPCQFQKLISIFSTAPSRRWNS